MSAAGEESATPERYFVAIIGGGEAGQAARRPDLATPATQLATEN